MQAEPRTWPLELWQCRACETFNDFDGIERALNMDPEMEPDHFRTLGEYKCAGCGFSIQPEAMWFVTPAGEEPVFIESGFHFLKVVRDGKED